MSNTHHTNQSLANDDESDSESTADTQTNSSDRSTPESTRDTQMVDEELNEQVVCQSQRSHSPAPSGQVDISTSELRPWTEDFPVNNVSVTDQNAQSNDRIAHPSDDTAISLNNLLELLFIHFVFRFIWDYIPFGIQDTQPHTMIVPVIRNTVHNNDVVINNDNGDINEDASGFNGLNNENLIDNDHERANRAEFTESTGAEVTVGVYLTGSIGAPDDNDTEVNDGTEQIMNHPTTSDIEYQRNLIANDDGENRPIHGQATSHSPTTLLNMQTNATATGLFGEAMEIEPLHDGPSDNNDRTMDNPTHGMLPDFNVTQFKRRHRKQSESI